MKLCEQHEGQDIHIRFFYALYLLDVIATTFYSLDIDVYKDPFGPFVQSVLDYFQMNAFWAETVLPEWLLHGLSIKMFSGDSNNYLKKVAEFAVKSRLSVGDQKKDLLQIFADAKDNEAAAVVLPMSR